MEDDMYRFLLMPRWLAGHVLLVVTVVTFVNLGLWQLQRLDARRDHNALVTERLAAPPVPLDELLATAGRELSALEYRRVTVDGRYRADGQVLTAPRSRDGRPGPQVLTVLQRDGGAALLIDRGWIPFDRDASAPAPPAGDVRIDGIVRGPEPGGIGDGDQVARIVPSQIAGRVGQDLPDFYVELWDQQPATAGAPLPGAAPELSEGSHQSYALQWFTFALIALVGYPALVWRTARERARPISGGDGDRADPADRPADPARIP
jgi:cytochrome oxidase assembly protein ShyY1